CGVRARDLAFAIGGARIVLVVSGGRIEQDGDVFHGPRDRAAGVLRVAERDDAGAAREPERGTQAYDVVVRARDADRAARVRAERGGGEVHRRGDGRAAAAAARRARRIVRVARLAAERADGREA